MLVSDRALARQTHKAVVLRRRFASRVLYRQHRWPPPRYFPGLTAYAIIIVCAFLLSGWAVYLARENKRRDAEFAMSSKEHAEDDSRPAGQRISPTGKTAISAAFGNCRRHGLILLCKGAWLVKVN